MNLKNKYIVLEFPEIWIKILPEDGLFFISLLRWYLMLITIEPFKERKHGYIFRFHFEKALACISHIRHFKVNRTFSLMNTLYRAKVGIQQRFVAPRQRASLQSHLPKTTDGEIFISKPDACEMEICNCMAALLFTLAEWFL